MPRPAFDVGVGRGARGVVGPALGTINLVIYGNSIAQGFNSSDHNVTSFAALLRDALPAGSIFHNTAVAGEFTGGQLTGFPAVEGETLGSSWVVEQVDAYYVPGMRNICLYWEGHNDLATLVGADKAFEHTRAMCRGRQNMGWRIFTPTLAPIAGLDSSVTDAYNALLKAHYLEFSDGIVLLDEDSRLSAVQGNPTYYSGDQYAQAHPNDAGHVAIFEITWPVLQTVIAMSPAVPITQFAFPVTTLLARWGTHHAKVDGVWRDECWRGTDLESGTGTPAVSTLAGLPAWTLDGIDDQFRGHGYSTLFRTVKSLKALALFMVVKLNSAGFSPIFLSLASGVAEMRCSAGGGVVEALSNSQVITGSSLLSPSTHHLLTYIADSSGGGTTTFELRVDGVSQGLRTDGTGTVQDDGGGYIELFIGSRASSLYAPVTVGEIVLCGGAAPITRTERNDIEAILKTKWGIT